MKFQFNSELNREIAILNWEQREFKVPRILNGRYEIIDILAAGGMGVIFVARDRNLYDKKVLIKRCLYHSSLFQYQNDNSRKDQIENIRAAMKTEYAAMLHGWARKIPNIPIPLDKFDDVNPEIYGPHKDNNGNAFLGEKHLYESEPYIVTNYFSGKPVQSNNKELNKNLIGFCEFYLRNVANILKRFHQPYTSDVGEFSFFYCDLKPGNVLLTDEKQIVLIDMGSFAITINGELQTDIITTPGYCAPELVNKQSMYLAPTIDVYTLAITVFELLTGEKPVIDQFGNVNLDWQKFREVVTKANASHWIDIFEKALQSNPQNRYQNLDEFISSFNQKAGNYNSTGFYQFQYFKEDLKNIVPIGNIWKSQSYSISNEEKKGSPIINYPIWKEERFFSLKSEASMINPQNRFLGLQKNLLQELFEKSVKNLIKNRTYLPELLEQTEYGTYINYVPSFLVGNKLPDDFQIKKTLEKILYLFRGLEKNEEKMTGIRLNSIKFDLLGYPFINDFWLLVDKENSHLLENPEIHNIIKQELILPPELKRDRTWVKNKSFVYLAGIFILLKLNSQELFELSNNGKISEKIDYERFIRTLQIGNEIKEVLLLLISPNPNLRPDLDEAISKIKERKNEVVINQVAKNSFEGIKIQSTENIREYQIQYREIGYITNNVLYFKKIENFILLKKEPQGGFKDVLEKNKTIPKIVSDNGEAEISKLLQDAVNSGHTKLAILIMDYSIGQMKNKLEGTLAKFSKVLLFAEGNPFNLKNLDFYPISNFMIKKVRK